MIRNGVDIDKLMELISAVKADPKKAQVKFQANTKWISGAYSKTKIRDFILEGDEPRLTSGPIRFQIRWKQY